MKLSSRRKWVGLVVILAVVAAMLIGPMRTKFIRIAASNAIGSKVEFASIRYHRKSQTVQLQDARTSFSDGKTRVQLCAASTFVKAELEPLLDKRLIAPRAKLENCTIVMSPDTQPAAITVSPKDVAAGMIQPWQSRLDLLLNAIEWQRIREECQSLVSADDYVNELDNKMRRWLLRSQQILIHAGQLSETVQSANNPLRQANEIRQQLKLLEELSGEQASLEKQFAAIDVSIADKLSELKAMGSQDIIDLRTKSERQLNAITADAAKTIVTEWAQCLSNQMFEYAHATRVLLPMSETIAKPFNMNIRSMPKNAQLVSFPMIQVDGKLQSQLNESTFKAVGTYESLQGLDYCAHGKTDWTIDCLNQVVSSVIHLTKGEQSSKWQIETTTESAANSMNAELSGVSASPDLATSILPNAVKQQLYTMQAGLDNANWTGTAKINLCGAGELCKLPCSVNADLVPAQLSSAFANSEAVWIDISMSCDEDQPRFVLNGALPDDFVTKLTAMMRSKVDDRRHATEATLAKALEGKCNDVAGRLRTTFGDGKQTLAKHRELLASVRAELKERIETDQSFEYARAYLRESISR